MVIRLCIARNQMILFAKIPLHHKFLYGGTRFRYRYVLIKPKREVSNEQYVDSKYEWRDIIVKGTILKALF